MGRPFLNQADIYSMRTGELYRERAEIQERLQLASNSGWEQKRLQDRLQAVELRIRQHQTLREANQ